MKAIGGTVIIGRKWNSGIVVERRAGRRIYRKRLRNWYCIDSHMPDMDSFAWGYLGTGPACTSYSILRELFGRKVAQERNQEFLERFVGLIPEDAELHITGDEICRMLMIQTGKE